MKYKLNEKEDKNDKNVENRTGFTKTYKHIIFKFKGITTWTKFYKAYNDTFVVLISWLLFLN